MTQRIQEEEQEFFEKRAKAVEEHTKSNPKLTNLIKDARKASQDELTPAKEYFEQNA